MNSKLRYFVQLVIFVLIAFATNFDYGFSTTYMNTPVEQFKVINLKRNNKILMISGMA